MDWEKLKPLKPDLLILDQEENLPWMKQEAPCEVLVSHITSISDMCSFAETLVTLFPENSWLKSFANRWRAVEQADSRTWDWNQIPGVLDSWYDKSLLAQEIHYVIWRNPWMGVGHGTFISSVFEKFGGASFLTSKKKYPTLLEADLTKKDTLILFSSEPFPFHKFKKDITKQFPQGAIVDGESYSWFGIRSLKFLEKMLCL